MTMKRIQREIIDIKKEDLGSIVLEPTDNLQVWRGVIPGPEGSIYEGGVFQVEIVLPNDYPFVLVIVSQFLFSLYKISQVYCTQSRIQDAVSVSIYLRRRNTNLFGKEYTT